MMKSSSQRTGLHLLYIINVAIITLILAIDAYFHYAGLLKGENKTFFLVMNIIIAIVFMMMISLFFFSYKRISRNIKELHSFQRKFEFVTTASDINIIQYDVTSRKFTHWNPSSTEPHKGFTMKEYWARIYPDDLPIAHQIIDFMDSCNNNPCTCEYRYLLPSTNQYSWQYNDIFPFEHDANGNVTSYISVSRHNNKWHEIKNKIAQFRRNISFITLSNGIMFVRYNVDNDTLYLLDNSGELTENIITFETYWNLIHPEDIAKAEELITLMREHKVESFQTEYRCRMSKQAEYTWLAVNIAAYEYDSYHRISSYMCLCRNNSTWRQAMDEMIDLRNKAESANKMKNAFLANISHEIRTPLNAVVGFSSLINDNVPENERNKFKLIIDQNNKMLLQIVDDVLALSKIESGDIDFIPTTFDIYNVIQSITDSMRVVMRPTIELMCESQEHFNVSFDSRRLNEIISSLLVNANKFTHEGHIKISYSYQEKGLYVSISDTGIGIALKDQQRIFERFEKVNNFISGTGLGLAICKGIIEQAHGKIGVKSELGKGSTFWFWIPCEKEK